MMNDQNQPSQPIPSKPQAKPWWQSKTIGFNSLVLVATTITAAVPALQQSMTAENYAVLVNAVALGNAILRLYTNKQIDNIGTKVTTANDSAVDGSEGGE
ncbi:hypothetical protein [uncultured Psychrobacter sp.]|uniref:hypothetical protein n=1 Tax=uncultured Psychrobacter sp. TaxID=259303 RepID=UPI00259355EA|nr:hypothetical protein [uncultured Psychrobacter sp.]